MRASGTIASATLVYFHAFCAQGLEQRLAHGRQLVHLWNTRVSDRAKAPPDSFPTGSLYVS